MIYPWKKIIKWARGLSGLGEPSVAIDQTSESASTDSTSKELLLLQNTTSSTTVPQGRQLLRAARKLVQAGQLAAQVAGVDAVSAQVVTTAPISQRALDGLGRAPLLVLQTCGQDEAHQMRVGSARSKVVSHATRASQGLTFDLS